MKALSLLALLALSGCATSARVLVLERKVGMLEEVTGLGPKYDEAKYTRLGGPEASEAVASVGWVPVQTARKSLFAGLGGPGLAVNAAAASGVTLDTTQTITGVKTFSGATTTVLQLRSSAGLGEKAILLSNLQYVDLGGGTDDNIYSDGTNITVGTGIDSTGLYINGPLRVGNSGTVITMNKRGTGTLDFPSTAVTTCDDLTLTVTGAVVNAEVSISVPVAAVVAGSTFPLAYVSATNTVTIRHCCVEGAACDPGSGTFTARATNP